MPEYSFEGLVRAVALGRREALVDLLHQAQCLQRSRQPVVRAAAKTACTEMVSLFVMGQPASSDPILDAHSVMHRPDKSYRVKNTQNQS